MKTGMTVSTMLLALTAAVPSLAKGPKGDVSSMGYSGMAMKSKYQQTPVVPSRLPTQAPLATKYGSASAPGSSASALSAKKYDRYSVQRPTSPMVTTPTASASSPRPNTTVRFPTQPTVQSTTSKGKSQPWSAQRPPIVFYPKPSPTASASTATPNIARPTTDPRLTRTPPTATASNYTRPPLRPDHLPSYIPQPTQPSVIINRPTTINQTTTNITHETHNTNNWFTNNQWQNQVTVNADHWNGRPWWNNADYGDWHHGHWHSHYLDADAGRNDWRYVDSSQHAWLNGLAAWGLGNLIYRTGYQTYANPYRVQAINIGGVAIDYARPITVLRSTYEQAYANDAVKAAQLRLQALRYFQVARQAFYVDDYNSAYDNINRAIALMPDDASMHEFRGLVLFAAGRYREAAEVVHAVLAVAPGWDWTTLSGLYRDNDIYQRQLRNLEYYIHQNPGAGDARFLLAYHYITLGHAETAAQQLRSAAALNPADQLANDLLDLITAENSGERGRLGEHRAPTADELQGEWESRRAKGRIQLDIDGDRFAWDYDLDDNDDEFRGKFVLADDVLVLATPEGSQMVGRVDRVNINEFTFQLLGSGADEGIVFVRD